jgi:hypothetical protein
MDHQDYYILHIEHQIFQVYTFLADQSYIPTKTETILLIRFGQSDSRSTLVFMTESQCAFLL